MTAYIFASGAQPSPIYPGHWRTVLGCYRRNAKGRLVRFWRVTLSTWTTRERAIREAIHTGQECAVRYRVAP